MLCPTHAFSHMHALYTRLRACAKSVNVLKRYYCVRLKLFAIYSCSITLSFHNSNEVHYTKYIGQESGTLMVFKI